MITSDSKILLIDYINEMKSYLQRVKKLNITKIINNEDIDLIDRSLSEIENSLNVSNINLGKIIGLIYRIKTVIEYHRVIIIFNTSENLKNASHNYPFFTMLEDMRCLTIKIKMKVGRNKNENNY